MSLGRAVDQAAAALTEATRDRTANEFATVPLPDQLDPRILLRDPAAAGVVGSYERPDQDFALVGVGEAARIDLAIGDTPTAARALVRGLFEGVRSDDRSPIRPRLIGGFRFAPDQAPGAPWERFGAGSLVLPRMLFVLEAGQVGVVLAPGAPAAEAIRLIERCYASEPTEDSVGMSGH